MIRNLTSAVYNLYTASNTAKRQATLYNFPGKSCANFFYCPDINIAQPSFYPRVLKSKLGSRPGRENKINWWAGYVGSKCLNCCAHYFKLWCPIEFWLNWRWPVSMEMDEKFQVLRGYKLLLRGGREGVAPIMISAAPNSQALSFSVPKFVCLSGVPDLKGSPLRFYLLCLYEMGRVWFSRANRSSWTLGNSIISNRQFLVIDSSKLQ